MHRLARGLNREVEQEDAVGMLDLGDGWRGASKERRGCQYRCAARPCPATGVRDALWVVWVTAGSSMWPGIAPVTTGYELPLRSSIRLDRELCS
ncbi:hypothetical protein KZX46_06110 [Polymorphobacter sp. PAMC 29334]|uniref:hypothetical protein n=1 Tax=Polymorphobacter sp. PAMC 29334 TaxID=2862331 RepID=UPI001C756FDA|nr:hypothetical protein [Polymorphobacter sp. PAMC 29334]QYE35546.1 hypothetical protein KZX46_06110 [Polymorphobacter sp. PAMC 29334]